MADKETPETEYTADSFRTLKGLDPVRERFGMYIGANDSSGFMHLLWEILDNAVDEAIAGFANEVEVILHSSDYIEVKDNGRGIPVGVNKETGKTAIEMAFTELHSGGKLKGSTNYEFSSGLNGVGASVTNALSKRLDVTVHQSGKIHRLAFDNGVPGHYQENGKFKESHEVEVIGSTKTTGTTVRYWPDRKYFTEDADIDVNVVKERMRQTSFLIPGLKLMLKDFRNNEHTEDVFLSENGLSDFVDFLVSKSTLSDTVVVSTGAEIVDMGGTKNIKIEAAFTWETSYDYKLRSFTNGIATTKHGSHVQGFEQAVLKSAIQAMKDAKLLKANADNPIKEDVLEGLVAVVRVSIPEPTFTSQTKEELGTPAARKAVSDAVVEALEALFSAPKKKSQVKNILNKIASAQKARLAAKAQREIVRKKNALEGSALPSKLKDCSSGDLEMTELLICEGDSAGGQLVQARDHRYQAIMPIRGKILNSHPGRTNLKKVMANTEVGGLITAMGAGFGNNFELDKIRYGKVLLVADADVDGSHIRCLLITFFWHYMRPYVEAGRLYAAQPPLYILNVAGSTDPLYAYTESEKDEIIADLKRKGRKLKEGPGAMQRMKGLGEMDPEQLRDTAILIGHRKLRRITANDVVDAEAMLDLLMGPDVPDRRDYIINQAEDFDASLLDV